MTGPASFGIVRAPEIDRPGLTWFNVDRPLALRDVLGKLVILDFWTFCCINCMHVLPALRRVEEAFPDELAVIGVHSPKFDAERDPAKVASAIRRLGITHPVAHDPDRVLWGQYAIRAWPTLVFVSPDGRVIGQTSGEPDPDKLLMAMSRTLEQMRREGAIHPSPLDLAPLPQEATRFRFPGKIKPLPGAEAACWALADGGHHQIVLLDDDGRELTRYGDGRPGLRDGPAATARFDGPQGLIADEEAIFVADTGNHAVRRIDRTTGMVTTLAGIGRRGPILSFEPVPGRRTALASPWDLEYADGHLHIANAGTHQILDLDLETGMVQAIAGTGHEGLRDGPGDDSHLAQPSGLALSADGTTLYIADSETSSIRALHLPSGQIGTLVGAGLFAFGHVNGPFESARLQHALGLAPWMDGRLLVADSYNGEVRVLDPAARTVADLDAGRFICTDRVCIPLDEPAGIWAAGPDRILLVDTNNHRIMEYRSDTATSRTWAG